MRWLFLGLLIVNALYFVWSQQDFTNNAIEDKPVVLPSKATQGQVQLVSEVPELQKQPLSAGLRQEQAEIMLLGGFAALSGLITLDAVSHAIRDKFKGKVAEANIAAAAEAYDYVKNAMQELAHAQAN